MEECTCNSGCFKLFVSSGLALGHETIVLGHACFRVAYLDFMLVFMFQVSAGFVSFLFGVSYGLNNHNLDPTRISEIYFVWMVPGCRTI
jgi:hypothetical protein